jgi:hypothetical protein
MASFLGGINAEAISQENEIPKIEGMDTSTASYLFDLATQTPRGVKQCLVERHTSTHPRGLFSIRFGVFGDNDGNNYSRLWAQRHILAKSAFYVISASPSDMGKVRTARSQFFLGKLKTKHNSRLFEGLYYVREGERIPVVAVVYEHDRVQKDRKMEVGIPSLLSTNDLMPEFAKIRYEGAQNHPSFGGIQFYHQRNDIPEYMSSSASLNDFGLHEVAYALVPSPKNFQLVVSSPFRSQYQEKLLPADDMEQKTGSDHELSVEVCLQLGKLEENLYSCLYQAPFNLLQAFMIILSRFETQQTY